jgi:hypothetical protein
MIKRKGHLINTNFIKNITNVENGVLAGESVARREGRVQVQYIGNKTGSEHG